MSFTSVLITSASVWPGAWLGFYSESSNLTGRGVCPPGKLDHRSTFPGFRESRLPHPTSSALSISMYNSPRKTGAKIIQSKTANKPLFLMKISPAAVKRCGRGLSVGEDERVSPLDQWLKHRGVCVWGREGERERHSACVRMWVCVFMYLPHVTTTYPSDSKGIQKRKKREQGLDSEPEEGITEDFQQYHLDISVWFKDIQLPTTAFHSLSGEASRCEEKYKLT